MTKEQYKKRGRELAQECAESAAEYQGKFARQARFNTLWACIFIPVGILTIVVGVWVPGIVMMAVGVWSVAAAQQSYDKANEAFNDFMNKRTECLNAVTMIDLMEEDDQ